MSEERNGLYLFKGGRPGAGSQNGLDVEGSPYEWRGIPGWNPAKGRHATDQVPGPEEKAPCGGDSSPATKPARLAEFTRWREQGLIIADAAALAGVSESTGRTYEKERLAARAGGDPR